MIEVWLCYLERYLTLNMSCCTGLLGLIEAECEGPTAGGAFLEKECHCRYDHL